MTEGLYALGGLGVLGGVTALVLGWRHEPAGDAFLEAPTPPKLGDRKPCWVDDPFYASLGYVSTDWLNDHKRS